MAYRKRVVDQMLADRLEAMGAVLIEGPKACGKTTTAEQQAGSVLYMDDPVRGATYMQLAQTSINLLLDGATPRLIDEWQQAPQLWDAIRFAVDHRQDEGQFILTGSAVPADSSKIRHTGTGRFAWLYMRPMSLWESGESSGTVSLERLFSPDSKVEGTSRLSLEDIAFVLCRGGWPQAVSKKTEKAALMQATEYYEAVTRSDISRVDNTMRNPLRAQRLLRSYARHQGSQASISTIMADMKGNEADYFSDTTIESYLTALRKIFVIEDMPAWNPNLRSKTAIRSSDTRYFVDASIATAALGIGPADLINDMNTFGLLFETMCMRDLRVYSDAIGGKVYHYRDKNGLECDAVVHRRNGTYGLIEIKIGGEKLIEEGVNTLLSLESKIDTSKMLPPSFKMVLTAVGDYAYCRADGVMIVPIGSLKP